MKKILAILLSLLTLLSCGLLSACSAEKTQPDTPDTETVWKTVSEAYIYAFPLVLTDATKTLSTNTDGTMTGRAPINQFNHAQKLADASFRTVVTPNVDTVYSQAWLDIREEPMIFVLPETDRFCNIQLLDAWTNTAAVLDKAGAYAIALPGWEGELPDGVTRVDVPTATVWSITRTVLSGNEDLPNVCAIQEQMQLLPLSAYVQGGEYAAPQGAYKEENDFVPVNKVLSMTPAEFFNTANALMQVNPPAAADAELLQKLLHSQKREQVERLLVRSVRTYLKEVIERRGPVPGLSYEDMDTALSFCTYGVVGLLLESCEKKSADRARRARQMHQLLAGRIGEDGPFPVK